MSISRISCRILFKIEFSGQICEKNPQIPNHIYIRQVGAEVFMLTDRHNGTNSRLSQFCEKA
jgi:hypothetical protein